MSAARLLRPGARASSALALRPCIQGTARIQFVRAFSMPSMGKMTREMEKMAREGSKKTDMETMTQIQKKANDEYFRSGGGPVFPGTFVSLPISQYPSNPAEFLRYQWYRIFQWGVEFLSVLQFKLQSMPDWTTRPKWKAARGKIAPTAKAMYVDMLSGFAAGDKRVINQLCLGNFGKKLIAAIDRRPANEITKFEVMSFDKGLFYPRVVAHQVHNVNPNDNEMYTEQAVVAILSTQKVTRHKASTGELIQGSTKIQQKVEHVVLSRQVSNKTYQSSQWRIWGTVPVTTMERYLEEQDWIRREQAKRAGWDSHEKKDRR
ncbi:hypothetical protein BGZ63DRAFT_377548 [Mariannaea sp. PMI_226]|nr:hypothetical protein BGZ63DRAFT_377548 [Mariannaea sp. PMI_226]